MTVREKKLNRRKQVINSFTWTLQYLLGVEIAISDLLSGLIKEDSKVRKIHLSKVVVSAITEIKLIEFLCILHKNFFRPWKKKTTKSLKVLRKREEYGSIYIHLVFSF
jgi:hypothetical protein